ncbi:hypothetical protein [Confluentibacter flavum]|uniref:Uncharacterized protein n=1 Tax=Confluentibacter flavum TaxID=1909700 RepID=A0A2N3HMT8_9FLAO|nr:hypothetical protein [Confluentibacter flavum]PKQ46245.1 hypothetical protein CSW08_03535 [Confluentibacter flavum]
MKKYTLKDIDSFIRKNNIIKKFLNDDDIVKIHHEWYLNSGLNFNDFLWLLFNKSILINGEMFGQTGDELLFYQNNYNLYINMAYFRREEGASSKIVRKFMRLGFESQNKADKLSAKKSIFKMKVTAITNINGTCEYAKSVHAKEYEVDNFLNECHIATDKCTNEFGCSCTFALSPLRDEKGHFIRKNI